MFNHHLYYISNERLGYLYIYVYIFNTSISTKSCSLQQYPNSLFFYFTKEKGFVTHHENKSDGNEIEFLFLNIFSHTLGNKTLTHVG